MKRVSHKRCFQSINEEKEIKTYEKVVLRGIEDELFLLMSSRNIPKIS